MKKGWILGLVCTLLISCQYKPAKLAYITNRDGNFNIYITDEKGNEHLPLTQNPGMDWYPKWNTQQGGILYYTSDTSGQFSIQMMDTDGEALPFDSGLLEECILSPDAGYALWTKKEGEYKHIYLYSFEEQSSIPIITGNYYNGRPQWSPTGAAFSFISNRNGSNELYMHKLKEQKTIQLTANKNREKYTSWSSDGSAIIFTQEYASNNKNDIFKVVISNKKITQITNDTLYYEEIAWSPNGKKIAFHGNRNGKHQIFTLSTNGKKEKQITGFEAYHGEPEWVPTGRN